MLNPSVKEFDPTILQPHDAVTLTATALSHIKKAMGSQKKCKGISFGVKKSGCSGYAYEVQFIDERAIKNHHEFLIEEGVSIFVKTSDLPFVKGTEIDYIREGLNSRFKFNNPNEKGGCGCGESFMV